MRASVLCALLLASGAVSAQSHLDTVRTSKALRVCTTGDYTPYSALRNEGQYEGIDISMAQSLAKSLNATVQWVPTTWKTLSDDFVAKQCDIAVGGVSISLPRQQIAWFAQPLDVDGKIPLVRCEDSARYQTVEQMNRPEVRLIEPAGGTNEAFVHRELPQAKLQLADNVGIFERLAAGEADVMITDASEALYQSKQHPTLCALNPEAPLQYSQKAYMLPRDDMSWKLYVDQWLHLSQATGEYGRIRKGWLGM